jgi:predicted anti-sigma-YlaC factor YlaD
VTSHLSPAEDIDALDGTLSSDRKAHLDECPRCRADVAALAETARDLGLSDVPEPSPLFWDHQAARIAEAVAAEPAQPRSLLPRLAWGGAVAAALVAALVVFVPDRAPSGAAAPGAMPAVALPVASADVESDHAWTLLTMVGGDLDEESAVDALHPAPDTVDEAVGELDPDERAVLAALLRDGLKTRS